MSQVHWICYHNYSHQKALCYCNKELFDAIYLGETMKLTVYADLNSTLLVDLSTLRL